MHDYLSEYATDQRLSNDRMAASSYEADYWLLRQYISMGHGRQREGRRTLCPRGFFVGFTSLNQLPEDRDWRIHP